MINVALSKGLKLCNIFDNVNISSVSTKQEVIRGFQKCFKQFVKKSVVLVKMTSSFESKKLRQMRCKKIRLTILEIPQEGHLFSEKLFRY